MKLKHYVIRHNASSYNKSLKSNTFNYEVNSLSVSENLFRVTKHINTFNAKGHQMNITEIVSLNKSQLHEQLRLGKISDKLENDLNEYFVSLRLSTMLLEDDEDLIGRPVAWLAGNDGNYRGVTGEIVGIGTGGNEGKVMVRGGTRNGTFPIRPDKLLDPVDKTPLGITLGSSTPTVAGTGDNNNDIEKARRTGFVGGLQNQRNKNGGWFRASWSKSWMYAAAAAIGLTVEWGTGESEGGTGTNLDIGQNFGDNVLASWWRMGQAGRLLPWDTIKEGATSRADLTQAELDQHMAANEKEYEKRVEIAYGFVCATYFAAITFALFGPVFTVVKVGSTGAYKVVRNPGVTLKKSWNALKKFINYLRKFRTTFTAASTAAGAAFGAGIGGIITGLVSFLLGTAAIWVVELVLTKSGAADAVLEWLVYKMLELDQNNAGAILGWDPSDVIISAGRITDELIDGAADASGLDADTELNNIRDIQNQVLTNPETDATTAAAVRALVPNISPDRSPSISPDGSTVGPSSNSTSTPGDSTSTPSSTSRRNYGI